MARASAAIDEQPFPIPMNKSNSKSLLALVLRGHAGPVTMMDVLLTIFVTPCTIFWQAELSLRHYRTPLSIGGKFWRWTKTGVFRQWICITQGTSWRRHASSPFRCTSALYPEKRLIDWLILVQSAACCWLLPKNRVKRFLDTKVTSQVTSCVEYFSRHAHADIFMYLRTLT